MKSEYLTAIEGKRCTLDANVLAYSLDNLAGHKQGEAKSLIKALSAGDAILTLQAISECYWAVSRKAIAPRKQLIETLSDLQKLFPVVAAQPACFKSAVQLEERYRLSFWDAMLFATIREAGVQVLFTEDLQHGQTIDGVSILNPFGLALLR